MRYLIINEPTIGCRYTATDVEVEISELPILDNDPWVKFHNTKTKQEYSCRLEAFLARYNPIPC